MGPGAGQQGRTFSRRGPAHTCVHHGGRRDGGIPESGSRSAEVSKLCSTSGAGDTHSQAGEQQTQATRYPHGDGPHSAGVVVVGVGADLRGGFQAGQLRFPPPTSRSGRDRRDTCVGDPDLSLGLRGGYCGVFRRAGSLRDHGAGTYADRRQTCPGLDQGIPEGGHHVRRRNGQGIRYRNTPGWHTFAVACQHLL